MLRLSKTKIKINFSKLVSKRYAKLSGDVITKIIGGVALGDVAKWRLAMHDSEKGRQNLEHTSNLIKSYNKTWTKDIIKSELHCARKKDLVDIYANRNYASKPYSSFSEIYTYIKNDGKTKLDLEIERVEKELETDGFTWDYSPKNAFTDLSESFEELG